MTAALEDMRKEIFPTWDVAFQIKDGNETCEISVELAIDETYESPSNDVSSD